MSRILWVDDEPYYLEAHRAALEEVGYQVEIAENAKRALTRLNRLPLPELIILDIIMPEDVTNPGPDNGMSTGLDLLGRINDRIKQQVPIIVLTVNGGAHDRLLEIGKKCKKLEVRTKPFPPSELLEEVNRLLTE
jgi:putative two-component system response regulator